MGVMSCSRKDCENIMCDMYSREYGYICSECFDELCSQHNTNVSDFMNSKKSNGVHSDAWRAYVETIFK